MKISNEFKIGFWGIVAIIVLIAGIDFLKGINRFHPGRTYYVTCPNVEGLAVSSHVLLNGFKVGLVRAMTYDGTTGDIIVEINVEDNVRIPRDSRAMVQTDLLGTSSIVLRLGSDAECYAQRDTLAGGGKEAGLLDKVDPIIPQMMALLPKLDSILTGINTIVNETELETTLLNVRDLTAQLNHTATQLNGLLDSHVPELLSHAASAAANLDTLSTQLKHAQIETVLAEAATALHNANAVIERLNSDDNTAGRILNTTELHDGLTAAIAQMDSLLGDIKAHPARYINISVFGKKNK